MTASRSPFVIAGAQKSCSTSLAGTLRMHSEIEMPHLEVGAFEGNRWLMTHRQVVRAAVLSSERELVFGFKRPQVFHEAEVGRRVVQAFPNLSAVVVLRDPAERMLSAYFHYVDHGVLRIKQDFEHHLSVLLSADDDELSSVEQTIVRYSYYASSVAALKHTFSGRALFLFQDDLLRDSMKALHAIQSFVGVKPDPDLTLGTQNAGRYPRRSNLPGRLFGAATYHVDPVSGGVLPRARVIRSLGRPLASFRPGVRDSTTKPTLSHELRELAQRRFGYDLAQLEATLGRTVPTTWTIHPD